jgi:GNAT superfamily N-acetyltransferase
MALIFSPHTDSEWNEARKLVHEYTLSLGIDLAFQDIETELDHLKEKFDGNGGGFFLAQSNLTTAGCVGFWRIDASTCEQKRLYVVPAARGQRLGEQLIVAVLDSARRMNYTTILLDTLDSMKTAIALYQKLGFVEVGAYRYNPLRGARYFSRPL